VDRRSDSRQGEWLHYAVFTDDRRISAPKNKRRHVVDDEKSRCEDKQKYAHQRRRQSQQTKPNRGLALRRASHWRISNPRLARVRPGTIFSAFGRAMMSIEPKTVNPGATRRHPGRENCLFDPACGKPEKTGRDAPTACRVLGGVKKNHFGSTATTWMFVDEKSGRMDFCGSGPGEKKLLRVHPNAGRAR
jgi:hypothetical protein